MLRKEVEILPETAKAFVQVMKTFFRSRNVARIMCATSDAVEAWFEETIPTAWHSNIPLSSDAHQLALAKAPALNCANDVDAIKDTLIV
jgi:hypothetical protein